MTGLRYDRKALRGDYFRAAAGLALSLGALWVAGTGGWTPWVFGPAALLFAAFGARTGLRSATIFELTEGALKRTNSLGWRWAERTLPWDALTGLKLRFFSTRRDRTGGWMELGLGASGGGVKLDSTLEGFDAILRRAAETAERKGIAMNETTLANLAALGVVVGGQGGGRADSAGGPAAPGS